MRILIVSEMSVPYTSGGGEVRYGLLAQELASHGHDVTWISMRQRASPDVERVNGVRHLHLGPRLRNPPVRSLGQKLRFMGSVLAHLLQARYDLVDCQTYAPLPAAWLATRLSRTPMVATIHDTATANGRGDQWMSRVDAALAAFVERRLYRLGYDRVITPSETVRSDLVRRFGLPGQQVCAVYNCVDVAQVASTPPDPQPCDLLFVGRLVPHKHPEHFLELVQRVNAGRAINGQGPVRAKVVGGGPLEASMRERAAALGLGDHVSFTGPLPAHCDVWAQMRSARLLVLPSTREGFGLVLAEAMAAGAGVCAYDVPAVRETLGTALSVSLAAPGDVASLASIAQSLLDNPPALAAHVALGHDRVRRAFDVSGFYDRLHAVYMQAVDAHQA